MDRMGDVVKKSDEAEKALDLQILNAALKKGRDDEKAEKEKAKQFIQKNKQMMKGLKEQVDAKRLEREQERQKNLQYAKTVIETDNKDIEKAKNEERIAQELRRKCRDIVVMQINERAYDTIIPLNSEDAKSQGDTTSSLNRSPHKMTGYLGHRPSNHQMSPEEIRLNRKLFEKIS